ncbi:FAD binding domain-containing protein [Immersiella caudata]|uniref:FAD binding domain-containing protein n=1 Tax=Immersiella caudata TaxID=314043 RepID=A0AA40C3K8_9PEZI|nr:FAD binding domain-containing protein [Immersiella caudata]
MSAKTQSVDVLICGSGSAGLCAAVWLSRYNINYKILERRSGRLQIGQADGVQTRTVEIFDSFGIADPLLKEAYHVLEISFWSPDDSDKDGGIKRKRYAADKETGISHQPHVILNQAKLNELMIGLLDAGEAGEGRIGYGVEVKGVVVEGEGGFPVRVDVVEEGSEKVYRAKYVLGCDGAHSAVRRSLGYKMVGDTSDSVWGVMDIYPSTGFPDIRKKCVINSAAGNILIIPREGDSLVRFYVELPGGTKPSDVTLESLHAHAQRVFSPYNMEFAETAWWSAYSIGQRHADFFHKDYRVFLTGDACHTHSPKAGQGMNVSLQDGHNIGWKLGMILRGLAKPSLLETYVAEREKTAVELIEFDRGFTKLFSSKYRAENGITPEFFAEQFVKAGRYTAGQAVLYNGNDIIEPGEGDAALGSRVTVGMRFPSAQVVRFCDAKAMQLAKAMPADGQWHVVVFAGDLAKPEAAERLKKAADTLQGIALSFTPASADPDSVLDGILVIFSDRKKIEQEQIPDFFTPTTGKWKMKSLMKTFADDESYNSGHGHAYKEYGVDPEKGAVVVVRPDQYVAKILKIEDVESLNGFFDKFLVRQR